MSGHATIDKSTGSMTGDKAMERKLTIDSAYQSLADALSALMMTHPNPHTAPGATWYAEENSMLADVCRKTRTLLFHGAAYIGASSINTGPEHGRRWVYARLNGDYSIGHVPAAISAWERIKSTSTWQDARAALTVPTSRAYKIKNFSCNVLTGGAPCDHDDACVTIDRHMYRLATYDTVKAVPEGATYNIIAEAMRRLARDIDMHVADLQAILWVALADRNKSLRSIVAVNGTWQAI